MVAWSFTPTGVVNSQLGAEQGTGAGACGGGAIVLDDGLRDGKRLSLPVVGSRAGWLWLAERPVLCCSASVDQV